MTAQITLRRIKGSALTYEELDDNFNALLTASNAANSAIDGGSGILLALADTDSEVDAQIQLTKFVDLDGTTTAVQKNVLTTLDLDAENIATPSGVGSLAYNSASGNYQYTPPDLSAYLTSATTITSAQLPAIAITSVQTAVDQAAMLALTTQEGDVVVRTDETRSYVRNSGTTDPHDMTNFTLLQTPDSDTTYGMTISQTGSGTDAVLNDNPILKLDPSNGTDIDITLTGGANTTVTRIGDTEVSIASTDTTYSISSVVDAADSDNHTMIRLSAGGSGSGDDDVKIKSGGGVTLATDNDGQITITGLSIGTSSTTALAGDTSYIASETDPVVGAISGIVKADGNGTISAAVAGTDYLAADADIDTLLLEVAKSSASLNTGDKSWIKVATVTIDARYQYYSAQLAVVGTGAASAFANEKVVAIRVKQQADMSNAPLVEVTTYNNSNEDYDFGHVVAVNTASETRVDIYFRADGPNSGAEIYKMAETATATVAWVTGFTANYVTSAPTNFVQGGVHEKWHSGNQAGIFGATNGIVKADGSGVLSAAVAGTDYDSPYNKGSILTLPTGDNSISSGYKHIKIMTIDLDAVGEHYRAVLKVNDINDSASDSNHSTVDLVFVQDQAFGNDPSSNIAVTTTSDSSDNVSFSVNSKYSQNTPTTEIDVYIRCVLGRGLEIFLESESISNSSNVTRTWNTSLAETDYLDNQDYNSLSGSGTFGDFKTIHTTESQEWDTLFGVTAGIVTTTGGDDTTDIAVIGNGNGFLKNNGSGTYSYDSTTYSTLQLGTTATTALAGNTTFAFSDITSKPTTISGYGITDALAIGTTGTTAMAGNTTFAFSDITSKPTTISGYGITDALAIGTTATTAMAGNTTFAFSDITSKPTTISGYGITDALAIGTSATTAMAGNTALSSIGGSLDLSSQVTGTLPVGNMSATALTTVQTAADQAAQLALTTEEGDVVVRTDENKTYMRNGGTADPHDMTNFTLLATPTDAVTSVDGNTGVVTTLQIGTSGTTAMAGNTTFAFADITSKPTTISGYGITDALAIGTSGTTAMAGNTTFAFADITSKPTTISGYGITDALAIGTSSTTAMAGNTTFAFADITSKPTTISGYGITDALTIGTSSTTALAGDTTFAFADITSKPTTISGYGITDALTIGTSSTTAMAGNTTFAFADITSKPTTISGYGITDAFDGAFASLSSKPTTISGYGITDALALGTTSTTALAGNTTSFGGSASSISLGTHSGTGTQNINIGGAVIGGASTNIKNIFIGNGANNGGATNVFIGPSSTTTTAQTTIRHDAEFEYGSVSFNGNNFTVNPSGSQNTITLGNTAGTGTIVVGRSTGSQTVSIASATSTGSKIATVNIAKGGGTRAVNIASDSVSGSTTVVSAGNPSATAGSTILLHGDVDIDRPLYGSGATEYYDFYDHLGGLFTTSSDGDWDISGTGLNALTEITIPAPANFGNVGKRGSLRMSCQSTFYNSNSTTKRNAEYYLGLQMKSKGTSAQSQNLGVGTFISSPSAYNGVWSFAGNVTDKICAGFGSLANNSSAGGMTYGPAPIYGVWYDDSVNKTYIRISSYYYYNSLGGSAVSAGNSTSFDVYYNPTEFKSTGTWVSSMKADNYGSRVRMTVQPQSTHQMHHTFNLSIPKDTSKTELRLVFDHSASNTDLSAAVYQVEGTVMLEGSRV